MANLLRWVLENRLQRRDGGAELVRDVGHQVPAHPINLGEVGGHAVERPGQLTNLIARGCGHSAIVVPACHRAGGVGHLAQRRSHSMGEELHHRQRERAGHEENEDGRKIRAHGESDHDDSDPYRSNDDDPKLDLDRRQGI
jgi:hypothetical protein